jgi:ribonuclease P/MRP protein subunit POP5
MVRIKYRYLTVQFLYPATLPETASKDLPLLVQFQQPTPDEFGAGRLMQAIRTGVEDLFGNYGLGMVNTGLKGETSSASDLSLC